jgi:hypothetical protein
MIDRKQFPAPALARKTYQFSIYFPVFDFQVIKSPLSFSLADGHKKRFELYLSFASQLIE